MLYRRVLTSYYQNSLTLTKFNKKTYSATVPTAVLNNTVLNLRCGQSPTTLVARSINSSTQRNAWSVPWRLLGAQTAVFATGRQYLHALTIVCFWLMLLLLLLLCTIVSLFREPVHLLLCENMKLWLFSDCKDYLLFFTPSQFLTKKFLLFGYFSILEIC